MQFTQITGFGGPVIHLGIDVQGIIAAPRRPDAVVPDTLQVQGQCSGPRPADHEIPAVLKKQFDEAGIGRAESLDAFIGRRGSGYSGLPLGVFEKDEDDPIEVARIIFNMSRFQRSAGFGRQRFQYFPIFPLTVVEAVSR